MRLARFFSLNAAIAATAAALAFGTAARAQTPLLPGATNVPTPPVIVIDPGTLESSLSGNYSASLGVGTIKGTYAAAVYRNASGLLDFYYQFSNDASSTAPITQFTAANFSGFTTSVGYVATDLDGPGGVFVDGDIAPLRAQRAADGSVVTFTYLEVKPGEISEVLLIRTDATAFQQGVSSVQADVTANFLTLAPAKAPANVPEPTTLALAGIGLLGMVGGVSARRRQRGA